ncbi:MAG TPA: glycosyltransferase family 39 protein [Anaerolineae bacterium]|nr:glycosyltransferase family 39 protein [Anaerolineae bacterium]
MKWRWAAVALLLIMFGLLISTLPFTSPTVDEPLHIVRGYAFALRGEDRLRLRGPVLSNALSGAALLLEPDVQLPPADDPIWLERDGTALPKNFLFANAAPPQRMVFLARLPILFVSLLLGALIFRWAAQLSGAGPALGGLLLYVFCPNLLAHARLATTDVVTATTFFWGAYAFSQALAQPNRRTRLISGVAFGLALAAKFSSAALAAAFVVQGLLHLWPQRRDRQAWRTPLLTLALTFAIGAVTLWAVYGFKIGPVDNTAVVLPAPSYWGEWLALNEYLPQPLPAYLFGEVTTRGWWYYYPATFLFKTPLPILLLLAASLVVLMLRHAWSRLFSLFLAPALLLGGLLLSPHDLGYRYLLPLLPFIFVASAGVFAWWARWRWRRLATAALLAWFIVGTARIYPYYLAYFNELAGGVDNGRFILSDSNLDWGQDLVGLKAYADQHAITDLNLSYFGNTPPSMYELATYALPPVRAAMNEQGAWWLHRFYPRDPAPGVYAISVANLMGGLWNSQSDYAYFRAQTPDAVIGHTIYVYTIAPRGPAPANLSLAGLQIDQIDAATYRNFNTNDVRPRWFEAASALIAAPGESWIAIADDQSLAPEFRGFFAGVEPITRTQLTDEDRSYALYHFDLGQRLIAAAQQTQSISHTVIFGDTATLIGCQIDRAGNDLTLITYWRAGDHIVTPLQMFVHADGPDGAIVAQSDRLDASPFGWQPGDVFVQIHRLSLPPEQIAPSIEIGLYNSESGVRLPVSIDGQATEHVLLK